MARAVTMKSLEDKIRWQADHERATLRHTSEAIRRAANNSIQRFRELISDNGHPYFLTSHSGRLDPSVSEDPKGSGTKFPWGLLDTAEIEPAVVRIYGLDLTVNGVRQEMDAVQFKERNYYQYGINERHIPIAYFGYDETKLGILPPPDRDYEYTLWYLPLLPELMADDDEFNPGIPGAEEWVIWDVMYKLLNRDNYPNLMASVARERASLMDDIMFRAAKHDRSGPPQRLDTRNRTRNRRDFYYLHWRRPSGPIT